MDAHIAQTVAGFTVCTMPAEKDSAIPETARVSAGASVALNNIDVHTESVILGYAAPSNAEDVRRQRRLAELGFLPGERVRVVSRGWFKRSPVAVRVADSTFALRDDEAALVLVQVLSQS
ncbi:FeoA family protein [Hydrogenophaga sp. 5NK40-0174]|uniref:FeoA family protein n=1 Tax=Hydrogenophaga sp. 5NK40-0174 TaxID=3127649 RepID=UPI003106A90E